MDTSAFLHNIETHPTYNGQIVHVEHIPPRPARYGELDDPLPGGRGETVGEALLAVHHSYKRPLEALFSAELADAAAHITGGGLTDNLPRVFPHGLDARIERGSWPVPTIFSYLAEAGNIDEEEMYQVFNMGVGMVLIVAQEKLEETLKVLKGLNEKPFVIGKMIPGSHRVRYV